MEISHYRLRARASINPLASRKEFDGVLLRHQGGFGCIHPWPELGDRTLGEELDLLRQGHPGRLGARALACCRIDGAARREGRSLWDNLVLPESHFTSDGGAVPEGFRAVKVKGGASLEALERRLLELPPGVRIRLDCNAVLREPGEFLRLWEMLAPWRERIDFVEDPLPYDEAIWRGLTQRTGCPLAVDRWDGAVGDEWIRVIKPALQQEWTGGGPLVFTSYMDHPVGQLFAAWCAAQEMARHPGRILLCGLVTHHLFDPEDPFIAALGPARPILVPPGGTGLGWNELLETLPWKVLE